jgi:hypothetical protein
VTSTAISKNTSFSFALNEIEGQSRGQVGLRRPLNQAIKLESQEYPTSVGRRVNNGECCLPMDAVAHSHHADETTDTDPLNSPPSIKASTRSSSSCKEGESRAHVTTVEPPKRTSTLLTRTHNQKKQTNRDLIGSRQTALETAQLLYRFVGVAKFSSIEALVEQIKTVGRRLVAANPKGGGGFVRLGRLVNARQADCETKTPHVLGSYVPRRARGR